MIEALMFILGVFAVLLYQFLVNSYYRIKREVQMLRMEKESLRRQISDWTEFYKWKDTNP
jgi:midasin (ATPase involved in ribosome maturation)